jgi:hypothetical protein
LIFVNQYIDKQFGKARQNTGRSREVERVIQVYKQANTNNMDSQQEEYIIPKSHALANLLQLGQLLESVFIHLHLNKLRKLAFDVVQ